MTPELWTRCPKSRWVAKTDGLHVFSERVCPCHGTGAATVIEVPFDEAIERMWRHRIKGREGMTSAWHDAVRQECYDDLLAALGEDT